jgi:hypothetical protein
LTSALACGDDDDDITGPTGVVVTFRDTTFNFTTLHTFAMPDTVIHFTALTGTPQDPSRQFDATALNEVRQNLIARGYTQVTDPRTTRPDFIVLVGATATTNYNAWVSYSWYSYYGFYSGWGWYAPGFGTDWGIFYPWYPTVGVTAYERGTLLVTIVPTLSVNPLSKQISAAWAGAATGLLNGEITATTVQNAVDIMFQQSPYLTASPLAQRSSPVFGSR